MFHRISFILVKKINADKIAPKDKQTDEQAESSIPTNNIIRDIHTERPVCIQNNIMV